MQTGFNTDVVHDERTFHVQTEDRGKENPIIETLIYVGGQILDARQRRYKDVGEPDLERDLLSTLIERQHLTVVRDIRLGKYDPPERQKPFGDGIITDRSLDEVVKTFIEEAGAAGTLPPRHERGTP
jgi:hypothetical protein